MRLIPYLSNSAIKINLKVTGALLQLTLNNGIFVPNTTKLEIDDRRSVITKMGVLPTILNNFFKSSEYQPRYQNLFLLLNLSYCGMLLFKFFKKFIRK